MNRTQLGAAPTKTEWGGGTKIKKLKPMVILFSKSVAYEMQQYIFFYAENLLHSRYSYKNI